MIKHGVSVYNGPISISSEQAKAIVEVAKKIKHRRQIIRIAKILEKRILKVLQELDEES